MDEMNTDVDNKFVVTMNLENQLKAYLKYLDLSISELSRQTDVPKQTISTWMKGKEPRNLNQVKKVAKFFKTTVDHLAFGNGVDLESKR